MSEPELTEGTPSDVLEQLLREHPEATLGAINEVALFVDVPPSLVLNGQRQSRGKSALDVFCPSDWEAVIAAWEVAQSGGIGRATVHLQSAPDVPHAMYVLDVRPQHGVFVGMHHPSSEGGTELVAAAGQDRLPPRFGQVRKDELAVLTWVDDNAERMLGRSAGELVGLRSSELVHPEDHELALRTWMEMLSSPGRPRRVVLRHEHPDGHWLWLEVTNHNLLEDPAYGCVLSDLVDVTPQVTAMEDSRARQELLDRLAEAVPVGLLQMDLQGAVVYANSRLHEIVGRPAAATADEQLEHLARDDAPRWSAALGSVLLAGEDVDVELTFLGPGGLRVCQAAVRPLRDRAGSVSGAIVCLTDTTQSVQLRAQLHQRATYDPLTGCLNRGAVLAHVEQVLLDPSTRTALVYCDVDDFKQVNDEHGHAAGDAVLRELARRLAQFLRRDQVVGRIGGDEFLVVLPHVPGADVAAELSERLRTELSGPVDVHGVGTAVPLEVTVGVAWVRAGAADALVAEADAAMYRAKRRRQV